MRAFIVVLIAITGATMGLWLLDRPASAQSSAVAVLPSGCFLLDGNGEFVSGIRSGNEIEIVVHGDGSIEATCRARLVPAGDGLARTWNFANTGRTCALLIDDSLVQTEHWEETVTPEGIGALVCRWPAPVREARC